MLKISRVLFPFLIFIMLTGCGQSESGSSNMDYEQTKKMVVDILKTDDGKKAIQELMEDDKMKEKLVMDQTVVSETIEKTLTSDKGTEFWKKSFEDPKFAESIAKSMKKENEKLLKDLMKDPEYRGMMIEVLKDPELEKEMTTVLKSKEYREHLQTVVTETFESPLFKAKIQDILLKAASEVKGSEKGGGEKEEEPATGDQGDEKQGGETSGEGSGS
ncbi:spore germination lipoprotein GerD [Cytobacillus sp. FJAT-53684]|uniref:Spore germination lipoprotein GerD n=1 Tax=Cytobacillus mangrovibacter TaxID=3299024 RepID=A0ABW6K381_9BACI